jgi:hypothetical protein
VSASRSRACFARVAAAARWTPPDRGGDEADTQTRRRFELVELSPFRYDTPAEIAAWVTHLAGVEEQLRLLRAEPGMLTGNAMPEYLFRRTGGVVGLLERLIEDGCAHAVDTGAERLTTDLLDGLDINLGNAAGRDPAAGEIPGIPTRAPAATTSRKRSRGRNTVFDDKGTPATATAATT